MNSFEESDPKLGTVKMGVQMILQPEHGLDFWIPQRVLSGSELKSEEEEVEGNKIKRCASVLGEKS